MNYQENNNSSFMSLSRSFSSQTISQKKLFLLYTFLLIPYSITTLMAIGTRLGLSSITPYFFTIFITIAVLFCFKSIVNQIRPADLFFIFAIIAFHLISRVVFPDTAQFSEDNASYFILSCLPMYFIGLTIKHSTSREMFVVLAYLALFLQILYLAVLGMGKTESGDELNELMTTSYTLLPFVLFLLWYALERHGIMDYLVAVIGVFVLFSLGTRGPVICLAAFLALYFLFYKSFKRNVLVKSIIVLLSGLLFFFSNAIAFFFSGLAVNMGLSTRVFDSVIEKEMMDLETSSGRETFWEQTIDYLINNKVLFGEGLYSDRIISGIGNYSHNLELELLCSFGLVGGLIVFFLLARLIYKAFKKSQGTNGSIILLVFFCSSILRLQFSSSFLRSAVFWLFIGICVSMCRTKNSTYIFVNNG